jgi:hypothetical protein
MSTTAKKPQVKLTGEDGNVFAIMGTCLKAARRAGWPDERMEAFVAEAKAGDYDHSIQTCMKYFDVE